MGPKSSQPTSIGRYEIVGPLATGGMAEVLLGRVRGPSGFERPIVIKRILPHFARMPEFRQMFLDEARIVANVRHRNVVAVHELGEADDDLFLVMEYLEGESVSSLLRQLKKLGEPLGLRMALHLIAEAAAGLHAAHELTRPDGTPLEVVHRDVSPHNLFVLYDGQVKVIDFGIAKGNTSSVVTQVGQVKGKYGYMAPEQVRAHPLDRRADVFALGVILYETTTGKRLFDRDNDLLVMHAVCDEPITPPGQVIPGYPAGLEAICMTALARDRDQRYPSAAALRQHLVAFLREWPGREAPEDELAQLMKRLFRDRIAEKTATLRAIQGGSAVPSVPPGEPSIRSGSDARYGGRLTSDPGARTPSAVVQEHLRPSMATPSSPAPRAPQGAKKALTAVAALGVAVGLGGAAHLATRGGSTPPTASSLAAAPPSPAASIAIEIASTPSDAEVWVGGERRGRTPMRLELPRGASSTTVELRKEGFLVANEPVLADADQRLSIRLAEAPRPLDTAPSADTPASAPDASASAAPLASADSLPAPKAPPPKADARPPKPKPAPKPENTGFGRFD